MTSLAADDLRVRLGDKAVLKGVSLAPRAGQITAIVGPNGAGKSTLLATLAGLRRPDAGAVLLDGAPLLALLARERARAIGFLPQAPEVAWAVDVRTLVGIGRMAHLGPWGLDDTDREVVTRALRETGLEAFETRLVTTLSGGERARAMIARALAGEPRWLLADEPLAGLDPGHVLDAMDLFRRLAGGGCGVVVTLHDLTVASAADRMIVLSDGAVIADDTPEACLTPETLAAAYGVEARVARGASGLLVEVLGRDRTAALR